MTGEGGLPFERIVVIDDPEPRSGPLNMALDELLLQDPKDGRPVLRFYRWSQPTVSFGYFEPAADARRLAGGREIVRRMTGGGLVEHGRDLTYTLVVPRPAPFVDLRSAESYRLIHVAIGTALARVGVGAEPLLQDAKADTPVDGNACFRRPVRYDLMANGGKIAGGAQRRTRTGLLHQGSVLTEDKRGDSWKEAARRVLPSVFAHGHEHRAWSAAELVRAREIAARKYSSEAWTYRC